MHNKDVIFAANAQAVEITEFATFLNTLIGVLTNVVAFGTSLQSYRIISGTRAATKPWVTQHAVTCTRV